MEFAGMSLQQIKEFVTGNEEFSDEILEYLARDERAGVRQLYSKIMRQKALARIEVRRLQNLELYEQELYSQGCQMIAGVDEAGRGPLAGPVIAAAVILPPGIRLIGLNDSKKVTPSKRDHLYEQITENAVAFSISSVSVQEIDVINIYQASLKAMQNAVEDLSHVPDYLLVDAVQIPEIIIPQLPLVKGDGLSASIAAASILAKVTRDRLMEKYDQDFPQYGFAGHKGYGTREHMKAIYKYGPCPIHRMSFNLGKKSESTS